MKLIPYIAFNVSNTLRKAWSVRTHTVHSKPTQISIEANERCNARCLMCNCWEETEDYLSKEEIIRVINELREWIGPHFFLQISGGEPLIFKGIYDIFRLCADQGILCKISTNGIALKHEKTCQRVIKSGLKYLTVSIDTHKSDVHDTFRGVPGAFYAGMKGLAYLRKHSDMILGISAIIMKENVSYLPEFTDFLCELDIDRILFQPIRAYGMKVSEWKTYPYWIQDLDALEKGIEYIKHKKKKDSRIMNTWAHLGLIKDYFRDPMTIVNQRQCTIGFEHLEVNYKGDVFLCNAFPSIGSIKTSSIQKLWKSDRANEIRKQMLTCPLPCTSNCKKEFSLKEKIQKFFVFLKAGLFK
jgi:MoaA/NifB/PqqE/SkfB family radical SAM enzyme